MDEMMVRYKSTYYLARKYMPKKPHKGGMKIWCLLDAISRYVHDFDIYCGAGHFSIDGENENLVDGGQGAEVVDKLVGKLAHRDHLVVMDNFLL